MKVKIMKMMKMMNKQDIILLTPKEIENILNDSIKDLDFTSIEDSLVKGEMINSIKAIFSKDNISIPFYTNNDLVIVVDSIRIYFKVTVKKTSQTVQVSRLKKKDVKKPNKFKFIEINIEKGQNSLFIIEDSENYKLKIDNLHTKYGNNYFLKFTDSNIKIDSLYNKDFLYKEIEKQNTLDSWCDIKKLVILDIAQPFIQIEYFKPGFNQEIWDNILLKVEQNNKELIDSVIDKIITL